MKKTSATPNPTWINAFQRNVLEQYDEGEYLYLLDFPTEEAFDQAVSKVGDGLFVFAVNEMSTQAGCESVHEAICRLKNAVNQISRLNGALHSTLSMEVA